MSAAPDSEVETVLPLAARNAIVELLLDDLGSMPRPKGSLVARAAQLLALAPGSVLDVSGDADDRRALGALRAAGLLAWSAPARADDPPMAVVRVAAVWGPVAAERLRAYERALANARHGRDLPTRLAQARALFSARLFFEVHEVLEPPWQTATGHEREILQGVIQAAVAWHHAAGGNRSGALRLATSSRVKLEDAPDAWHDFPLRELRGAIERLVEEISSGGSGAAQALPWTRDDGAR